MLRLVRSAHSSVGTRMPTLLWADLTNRPRLDPRDLDTGLRRHRLRRRLLQGGEEAEPGADRAAQAAWQIAIGLGVGFAVYALRGLPKEYSTRIQFLPSSSWCRTSASTCVFVVLAAHAVDNAVNLTDGLDGLAIGRTLTPPRPSPAWPTSPATALLRVPRRAAPARRRRGGRVLRSDGRRLDGVPVVELLPGPGVHGRRRQPGARRRARHRGHPDQAGAAAVPRGRPVRDRGVLGDPAGGLLPPRRASASSGCRRCTTTSSSWAGRSRR